MQEYLEIGQIVNTLGLKGMVKIVPFTDDIHRFDELTSVMLERNQQKTEYEIEQVMYRKNMVYLKFKGIDRVEEAERLRNSILKIHRSEGVKQDEDSYYIVDLLGLPVYSDEGKKLGVLEDIFNTGSNDIYVVKDELGKQILLPAISDVIKNIDLEQGRITVHVVKGLME